jgi:hypothetical protein
MKKKKNKIDKAFEDLWAYGTKRNLDVHDWILILEGMRMQIIKAWVMQDFNKDGNYVIQVDPDGTMAKKEARFVAK